MADRQHRPSRSDGTSPISPLGVGQSRSTNPPLYDYQDYIAAPSADELAHATLTESRSETSPPVSDRQFGAVPSYDMRQSQRATVPQGTNPFIASEPAGIHFSPPAQRSSNAYDPVSSYFPGDDQLPNRYNRRSHSSLGEALDPPSSSSDRLTKPRATASLMTSTSKLSKYDHDFGAHDCPANKTFYQGGSHWLSLVVWTLAIYSTVFSGIYLILALRSPRWGKSITSHSNLTPATANVLVQLFGKMIELSFVTVFVTFLGQVLSRRSFSRQSAGISLAELSMRNWIFQPGTVLTHPETVRYAGLSFLGALSLTVMVLSILYTTAATALVTPTLRFGGWEPKTMFGLVKTTFANPTYLNTECNTPVKINNFDPDYTKEQVGQTCLTIDHASQSFHNYQQYLNGWTNVKSTGVGTDIQQNRVKGYALYQQNTTVNGSWINNIDTRENSQKFNRIINNVTLAMPHSGVFQAAKDPKSQIMQPEDLDGIGAYNIRAAVPSPYINVLCAHVTQKDISKIVYSTALNATLNVTADLPTAYTLKFPWGTFAKQRTPVDDVFGWSEESPPPVFYKFPSAFNTLLNNTIPYGRDSIYLLGKGGPNMATTGRGEYLLCKAKAGLTPNCHTVYNAVGKSGEMAAECEIPNDPFSYIHGNSSRETTTSLDWINVAITGFNALSLNNGVTDGGASNARLLMQLMLQKMELNPSMPSPAEALAVMGGSMLLMSAQDSPFVEFWNYSSTELIPGEYQTFQTSTRAQQFASGGSAPYQRGFHVVLLAVFLLNVFVLIYMIVNRGLVTDFSEPPNLFSLTINSPPNKLMRGSCGAGPEGKQYAIKWGVEMEGEHLYITDKSGIYPSAAPSNMRGGAGGGSWFGNLFRRRGKGGGKYDHAPSEVELGSTGYQQHPQDPSFEHGSMASYASNQPAYATAPTAYLGVPVVYEDGQAVYAGHLNAPSASAGATSQEALEAEDAVGPLEGGRQQKKKDNKDANISRMFSKIAKRKSHL